MKRHGKLRRRWGCLALGLALGLACPTAAPAAPGQSPAAGSGGEPLGLVELTELAMGHQPQLQQAAANREASRARQVQQKSYFWPQVAGDAHWVKTRNERSLTGDPGDRQLSAGLTLDQAVFDYSLYGQAEAAAWEVEAYDRQYQAVVNQVVADVRYAYFSLLTGKELLAVSRAQEEDTRAFRDRTRRLLDQGLAARPELARAELDLAEARRKVIENQANLRRLAASLAEAVGVPQVYDLEVGGEVTARPQELAEAALEETGQAKRPEVQRLDYLAKAAAASIEAAWGHHLPTLDLRADLGQSGRDTLEDEYHDYGLYLGLPIFTGWRVTGAVTERRALHRAALKALEQQRQGVRREVRQGWQGLLEARAKVEVGAAQLAAAEENWRLVRGRYDNGLATPLELSEARTQRFNAQAAVAQAHYGVLAALAELDRAVGGELDPFLAAVPPAPATPSGGGR